MSLMDRAFARFYPAIINTSEKKWLREARRELLAEARGDVVEIGTGVGHNLSHYGDDLTSLTLTEFSPHMVRKLRERVAEKRPDARIIEAPAEKLPLPDDSADFVVSTLVLCSAPPEPALREVKRILRPGGTFLLIEHVLGDDKIARKQRRAEPVTKFLGRGCHVTRNIRAELEKAGFDTSEIRDLWVDAEPKIYAPHIVGRTTLR